MDLILESLGLTREQVAKYGRVVVAPMVRRRSPGNTPEHHARMRREANERRRLVYNLKNRKPKTNLTRL